MKIYYEWANKSKHRDLVRRNPYKKVIGFCFLDFLRGRGHGVKEKIQFPNHVHFDDGWNCSFHNAFYDVPAIVVIGKNHKKVRDEIHRIYQHIEAIYTELRAVDVAKIRMFGKSLHGA